MKDINRTGEGVTYYNLGVACQQQGKLAEAIQAFHRALEIGFSNADVYINLGVIHYENGELDQAIQSYLKAIEINPSHEAAFNILCKER